MPIKKRTSEEVNAFLNLARDRFQQAAQADSKVREKALDDLKFSVGEQWPLDIQADRQVAGRPCPHH